MSAMTSTASSEEFRKSRFAGGKLEAGLGSLRRRDSSWDKKWQEHVVRTSVDMPRQIPRLSRTPCKINGPNAIDYNTVSKKNYIDRVVAPKFGVICFSGGGFVSAFREISF